MVLAVVAASTTSVGAVTLGCVAREGAKGSHHRALDPSLAETERDPQEAVVDPGRLAADSFSNWFTNLLLAWLLAGWFHM